MGDVGGKLLLGLVVLLTVPVTQEASSAAIVLPPHLMLYRTWRPLLKEPHPVSAGLWSLCRSRTEADWEKERTETGPHTQRLIMVYGNPPTAASLSREDGRPFPEGAILAKEKLLPEAKEPDGVAFMTKRSDPAFRDTGGWEFSYYPAGGDARRTHEQCASCHRGAAASDYVFGDYPREGGWTPQDKKGQRTRPQATKPRR